MLYLCHKALQELVFALELVFVFFKHILLRWSLNCISSVVDKKVKLKDTLVLLGSQVVKIIFLENSIALNTNVMTEFSH